jgi:hypothetical protein
LSGRQVRQGSATSLADKIEIEDVWAEAEPFADIAGETGTEIASAGADDEGVDRVSIGASIGEGAFGGLGCEDRSVFQVAGVKNVRRDIESLVHTVENKVARDNAVIAGEDFFDDGA